MLYKYPSEIKVQGERLKCEVEAKFDGDETRKISVKNGNLVDQIAQIKPWLRNWRKDGYRVEVLRISPAQVAEPDDIARMGDC